MKLLLSGNTMVAMILICAFSFLCGSIPFGYILVRKYKHVDVRTVGSGNIGSTNVKRVAGSKVSLYTQLLDMVKGMLPVFLALFIYAYISIPIEKVPFGIYTAFCAILGHDFSPFLKFRGGKGVNTTIGAFFPLLPIPVILTGFSFKLLKFITPIVSIRSITISLLLPLYGFLFSYGSVYIFALLIAALLIILKHIPNINRITHHTEL